MALITGTSNERQRDRQDEDFDRRLRALETAITAIQTGNTGQAQQIVQQIISRGLLKVGEVGGALLETDTVLFDPSDGFDVTVSGDAVRIDRTPCSTAAADLGTAASAGTNAEAANRDHVHKRAIEVRKNSGGSDFIRRRLNLIEGANVTLTVADDGGNDEVDVTIAATSSASDVIEFIQDNNTTINMAAPTADITILECTSASAVTVNLPPGTDATEQIIVIKRRSAALAVTVDADGSETIDGAATKSLDSQYAAVALLGGGGWFVLWTYGTVT